MVSQNLLAQQRGGSSLEAALYILLLIAMIVGLAGGPYILATSIRSGRIPRKTAKYLLLAILPAFGSLPLSNCFPNSSVQDAIGFIGFALLLIFMGAAFVLGTDYISPGFIGGPKSLEENSEDLDER